MFTVYKSNQLNILLSKICQIIQKYPLTNVFEKEIFVADNQVLFQYLNIFIANKIGISANFKLYNPSDFIWKLFQIILSEKTKNIFTRSVMTWKIMKIIDEDFFVEYINKKDNNIKKFKFSFLMANIFEKYIIYRPNWINIWEKDNNIEKINISENWQKKIWLKLIHNTKKNNFSCFHFAHLFSKIQLLKNLKKIKKTYLPNRLFIISSFSLNPSYLEIFKNISNYINIYFLYITPCKKNIFNFNLIKKNKKISLKTNFLNNLLMELWGKYEKMYSLYLFKSQNIKVINCFKKTQNSNILNDIQNDIFETNNIQNKKYLFKQKKLVCIKDNSISINVCCNKEHEIQILYNQLLFFLNNNSDIQPRDIIVISNKIENYIPYINLVFKSTKNKKQIPFNISKKYSKNSEIIMLAFKKILNLPNSRFNNEEILSFLDVPEIANNFHFSEEEINILYNWIETLNIRWSVDKQHQVDLGFPKNRKNTWMYGIEKLLLSYAMDDNKKIWNNILSCLSINTSRSELIGKLCEFINTLNRWRKKLLRSQYLTYWYSISESLINDFFLKNEKTEKFLDWIQKTWQKMINDSLISNYKKKISINLLKKNFFYICNYANYQKFLPGVINFCHPSYVCYIPFKIICIIGADHRNFPNKNKTDNFDLLQQQPLIGDFDAHKKDCYLFLQSLSCAQKYFYISYVGYSIKNNTKVYPSILLDQLLNYISYNFCFINDENISIKDNKKKILQHFVKKHNIQSLYKKKIIINNTKNILNNKTKKQHQENLYYKTLLSEDSLNKISLTKLIYFWKNPIRYFFNVQLQIKFNLEKKEMNKTESFIVHILDRFKINCSLLKKIIHNQETKQLFQYYELTGILPYGFFGKIFWNKQIEEMKNIAKIVNNYKINTEEKQFNLKIKQYQLYGTLSEIQNTGLLRWKPSPINYNDRISLWLEHLIYSVLGGTGTSKIIGYKKQTYSFSKLNTEMAYNYLLYYITGYMEGVQKPLFLTKSGSIWVDQIYDIKNNCIKQDNYTRRKGYKKLLNNWMGNNFFQGEKDDVYIKQIITELNISNIKKICKTAEQWLIPMLKNIKKIN